VMWLFRRRRAKYHGDGLWELGQQPKTRDQYTGEKLDEGWADRAWAAWDAGAQYHINADDMASVCPVCYHVSMAETARHLGQTRPEASARANWSRHLARESLMLRLLGRCRCDRRLTAGQAAADARRDFMPRR
jgi:hypothetical protein